MANDIEFYPHPNPKLPFSAAVRTGNLIHLSGQIGVQPDGALPEGIVEQTHQAMRNLAASAELAGTGLDRVVKCTIMLADIAQWEDFNRAYLTYFNSARLPARSAFGTDGLAFGALVELDAIAVASGVPGSNA